VRQLGARPEGRVDGQGLHDRLRHQARRRVYACPLIVVPFLVYLAVQAPGWPTWMWVLAVTALAAVVSVVAGEQFENPRHQFGRGQAAAMGFGLGIVLLYTAQAVGGVTAYFTLASLAMVYLMTYWFVDSLRILRQRREPTGGS